MSPLLPLVSVAFAKPEAWFADGAGSVRIGPAGVEVGLLRGPTTGYLPAVMARIPVGGVDRPQLVVLDLASGPCRVDPATVHALGLSPETDEDGAWLELERLAIGDLELGRVRVRVEDGSPGLVLGVEALPELGVALLPSTGKVRFVPASRASSLLSELGEPIRARRDGLALAVPGATRWGPAVVEGTFRLRTDLLESRIAPSEDLPSPTQRGGRPYHDVGARLGDLWLAETWIRVDPALPRAAPGVTGALGEDVLFAVDLAVDPRRGRVAFRENRAPASDGSTAETVRAALERYRQEEERAKGTPDATGAPVESRATIGFDGPVATSFTLGDPGNPVVRDRNLQLADTLWAAGQLSDALPRYLSAAQYAGDHCGAHLRLGERRMAWAGAQRVEQDFVATLVEDPLVEAALLWDAWTSADEATRDRLRAGLPGPPNTLAVAQPDECRVVWGLLHRVQSSRGRVDVAERIERDHPSDPAVAWARVLDELDAGRYGPADALLPKAEGGADPLDLLLAEIRVAGGTSNVERIEALARQVPGAETDHPLVAALVVLEGARHTRLPSDVTGRFVRADPSFVPARIADALATGAPPPPWDDDLERRRPGDPRVTCERAAHLATSGKPELAKTLLDAQRWPAEPDWWAALAVVAQVSGDAAGRDAALRELRLRFPMLPVGDLGLVDPPARTASGGGQQAP